MTDKSYRPERGLQPITRFLTPSPPKGSPPDGSPTSGQKRRSARINFDDQPDPKRPNISPPGVINGRDLTSHTSQSMDLTGEAANGHAHTSHSSIEEIVLDPVTLEDPPPNSSVEIIGERAKTPMAFIDLVDDTLDSSQETERGQVISVSSRDSQNTQPPDGSSPVPDDSGANNISRANITLHTNIPMDRTPQHVFVKAENNRLSIKFLTFRPTGIDELVRAFFAEDEEFDNPGELEGLADFAFERLLTPDDSQDSAQAVNISTASSEYDRARVSTVSRDSPNISRTTVTVSDPDDSVIPLDDSDPQTMSQSIRDMDLIRDIGFERESSIQIQNVRTAGETTLDDLNDDTNHRRGDETETTAHDNGGGNDDQAAQGNGEGNEAQGRGNGDQGVQGNGGDEGEEEDITQG